MKKAKILFVLPSLQAGGAERVMSYVAQNFSKDRFEVKLIVISSTELDKYDIKGIEVLHLNIDRVRKSFFKLNSLIRRESPEVVIGTISHLNALLGILSIFHKNTKFVGRQTTTSSTRSDIVYSRFSQIKGLVFRFSYGRLDRIICQSADMRNDLIKKMKVKAEKLTIINNPISDKFTPKDLIHPTDQGYKILTVGRLTKQKGYDRLLRIVKKLDLPFHYTIIGDGPERQNLIAFINANGLQNYVTLIEYTGEVEKYLKESHLYLQGSYNEGFPNALIESLAVGTPAVVFKAPGGINEIIIQGENGYIAESEPEFLTYVKNILLEISNWTPEQVSKSVCEKYNTKRILSAYETLILSLLN